MFYEIFFYFFLGGIATANAQHISADKAPIPVKSAFTKNFPGATGAKWEREKDGYEVNFIQNSLKMAAVFTPDGSLKETETTIKPTQLPAAATAYITQNYAGAGIKEAAKLTLAGGETQYEAEVKSKDLIFDANGKFLKAVKP